MFLSDTEYESALEMLNPVPVNEAFGKGMKALLSKEAKDGNECLKEARKFKRHGEKNKAKKKYQEAIQHYQKVAREVEDIEDETIIDWVISLCLKPMWYLIYQVVRAEGDLKGLTRQATLKDIDDCIDAVRREMNSL